MKLRVFSETTALILAGAVMIAILQTACNAYEADEPCKNKDNIVDGAARHVLDVPLPFKPGPLAVLTRTDEGTDVSRSSRLWLGEGGQSLYALEDNAVWRVDIATGDRERVGAVDQEAGKLAGSEEDDTLVVSDPVRGAVWVLDQTRLAQPVRIPVGAGPGALALGPGRRLAYVANEFARSVSLVETGVGVVAAGERSVFVSSVADGRLVVLDGDGRIRAEYDGLPSRVNDLAVVDGGRALVATYSELVTLGDIGTIGDGELVLDEGVLYLDLDAGTVTLWSLERAAGSEREGLLARPTGLVTLDGGKHVAVALPGWQTVAVLDIAPGSPSRGEVLREVSVPGEPRWLARAALETDWLYALDDRQAQVFTLSAAGDVSQTVSLK